MCVCVCVCVCETWGVGGKIFNMCVYARSGPRSILAWLWRASAVRRSTLPNSLIGEETEESGIPKDLCRYTTDQSLIFGTEPLVSKKKKKKKRKRKIFLIFFLQSGRRGGGGGRGELER